MPDGNASSLFGKISNFIFHVKYDEKCKQNDKDNKFKGVFHNFFGYLHTFLEVYTELTMFSSIFRLPFLNLTQWSLNKYVSH